MSKSVFQTELVKLADLEQCPVRLTIHSAKKIARLEKIAETSADLLPPLEVAVLENKKKYVVKRHSVFEILRRIGKTEFKANIHFVKNLTDVVILHARMSQASPVNPLAVLDMRDYLVSNGFAVSNIADVCVLDPAYASLLKCDLSPKARSKLSLLIDMLSLRIGRVEMPVYMVEMISKRPKETQEEIVDRIHQYIGDEKTLSEKDFAFPNQAQIRLYTEISKKPEKRNVLIFRKEESAGRVKSRRKSRAASVDKNETSQKEAEAIIGNVPHLALLEVENRKFRIDWKAKTFSEVREYGDDFIIIQDNHRLKSILALSQKQVEFLDLGEQEKPEFHKMTDARQLRQLASKIKDRRGFRAILIFNKT